LSLLLSVLEVDQLQAMPHLNKSSIRTPKENCSNCYRCFTLAMLPVKVARRVGIPFPENESKL